MSARPTPVHCGLDACPGVVDEGFCDTCGVAVLPRSRPAPAAAGPPLHRTLATAPDLDLSSLVRSTGLPRARRRRSHVGAGIVDILAAIPLQTDEVPPMPADGDSEGPGPCPSCRAPLGPLSSSRPGSASLYCQNCGVRLDGVTQEAADGGPVLARGERIARRYVVERLIGGGGYGTTYQARDSRLDDRYCVLKRQNDPEDRGPEAAAALEREALAQISHAHPAIVDVYDYVEDRGFSYLVMEYLDGPTLRQVQARRSASALPVAEAAAFVLAVLPALEVMHAHGWVYCDFKPDNVIHVGDNVKLIDLGGARRLGDRRRKVQHTRGYAAPEVLAGQRPALASDVYTVGRTLAALVIDDFALCDDRDRPAPLPLDHPVLRRHDAFRRLLQRACAAEPAERFPDATQLATALHGVMRQAAARDDGEPRPDESEWFTAPEVRLDELDWAQLCEPVLPDHPRLTDLSADLDADNDRMAVVTMAWRDELSWSDAAKLVRAHCFLEQYGPARDALAHLDTAAVTDPADREVIDNARRYLEGLVALAEGDAERARRCFGAAYGAAPGELACVLAHAAALEASGADHFSEAAERYLQVALTERSWVVALGGLSRALKGLGRSVDAARVLAKVPSTHPSYVEALTLACHTMEQYGFDDGVAEAVLVAIKRIMAIAPDHEASAAEAGLRAAFYRSARAAIGRDDAMRATVRAELPANDVAMADAIEQALLAEARAATRPRDKHRLVDMAARTRPWTWR
jgi:serine/threonine-protein kinase PknG